MERKEGPGRPATPRGQEGTPSQEQAKPKGESELSKFLQEKGLFRAYTPERTDPAGFPIDVMKQITHDLDRKLRYDHKLGFRPEAPTAELENKYISWRRSIVDMTRAYEIIAYPFCKSQQLRDNIKQHLVDDLHNGIEDVQLNDEELELLGEMTVKRGLPFNPNKYIYEYLQELPDCRKELATAFLFSRTVFR